MPKIKQLKRKTKDRRPKLKQLARKKKDRREIRYIRQQLESKLKKLKIKYS